MPEPAFESTFWNSVATSMIGTFAGFVFAIILFYITYYLRRLYDKKNTIHGLKREAEFNIGLCDAWLKSFDEVQQKIAIADTSFFNYFDYSSALKIYADESLKIGLLYDLLSNEELVGLDKGLRFLGNHTEMDINDKIAKWKENGMSAKELSQTLSLHKFAISESRKALNILKTRIK